MKLLTMDQAKQFLRNNGVDESSIEKVISGFDFSKPVYEQNLWPGQMLYQFVRNSSSAQLSMTTGNWFGLLGANPSGLAIFSGGAGRTLWKFKVLAALTALEGTAARFGLNWDISIGGPGGQTQIYVPPRLMGCIGAANAQSP